MPKSTLLGCSAYEELTSANPYKQNYPQIEYARPSVFLSTNADPNGVEYYNHAFALIDFSLRKNPTDPVTITYVQYPSWGPQKPANPTGTELLTGEISLLPAPNVKPVQYGDMITLFCQEALYISPLYDQLPYKYPTATTNNATVLKLLGGSGNVMHGDMLTIQTTESAAGSNNYLGAFSTPALYYWSGDYSQLIWQIFKKDTSNGTVVNYGDEIYFVNTYHDQWLTIYWNRVYGNIYLTTKKNANYYWEVEGVVMANQ